jgi:hypothetical protein
MGRAVGVVAVAAALAAAGCGGGSSVYTVEKTAPCLRKLGYKVRSATDLVAGTSANGGLVARAFGNTLTIAFGADEADGLRLARVYRRVAPKRLRDLIQPRQNAVMVWTIAPTLPQLQAAQKCLR